MTLIISLFLLLAVAHALGMVCTRLRLPALAGHMIAGVLLGPSLLGWINADETLGAMADVAVFFVVLTAGLEMRLQHVLETVAGRGVLKLLVGFVVPLLAGAGVAFAFGLAPMTATVIALCLAVTALPVALQILGAFNLLDTRIARVTISGALLADIIVFMALGILIELSASKLEGGAAGMLGIALLKLAGLIAAIAAAHALCGYLMRRRAKRRESEEKASTTNLVMVLLFVMSLGALADLLGFHFAIGAFFAAMMVTPELIGDSSFSRLGRHCNTLTAGLFGPLFLAYQGVQFEAGALGQPALLAALITAAVAAKLAGGYAVGRLQHLSSRDALGVGIVMNAHGVMELIVASVAFHAALIDSGVFSTLLIVGITTTVLTPLMLRAWQRK